MRVERDFVQRGLTLAERIERTYADGEATAREAVKPLKRGRKPGRGRQRKDRRS